MKKIGRYIAILLAAGIFSIFLIFTSFSLNAEGNKIAENPNANNKIAFFSPTLWDDKVITYNSISTENISENSIFSVEFDRLATGFFVKNSTNNSENMISRDGKNIVVDGVKGIMSWYDPFVDYKFSDSQQHFSLEQITSGSIYFSHEDDETISLYSVDMVGKLTFLADWAEKTSMILFPGMYFRFDPEINKDMQGFDLLRIIQAQQSSAKKTGITFLSARGDYENAPLIPHVFRADGHASELFKFLEIASQERMKTVDALKNYTKTNQSHFNSDTENISNPTKKMYRLLGDLQIIFSRAVNSEIDINDFRTKTEEILQRTKEFDLEDAARKMIEQFLVDGRFALFAENNGQNAEYQKLYDSAANILGINPTTPKGKMFQVLSNIFSRNILESKNSNSKMAIDTINVLSNTLTQAKDEIATNDYFDMSLYSFLLLRVMADVEGKEMASENKSLVNIFYQTILGRTSLEENSLYRVYDTIFNATQRYVTGIDKSASENAQVALATDFYVPMLYLLVNSLYQTYTTNEGGEIYIKDAFINRRIPELSSHNHKEILKNLTNTYSIASDIFERRLKATGNNNAVRTKLEMQKYLKQLDGFIKMIDGDTYESYEENPYISESNSLLPQFDLKNNNLVKKSLKNSATNINKTESVPPTETQKIPENSTSQGDASIQRISKILNTFLGVNISEENISKIADNKYSVKAIHQGKNISFQFDVTNNTLSYLNIDSKPKMFFSDALLITVAREIFTKIPTYEPYIDKIIKNNNLGEVQAVSIHFAQKRIQIGTKFFPLP